MTDPKPPCRVRKSTAPQLVAGTALPAARPVVFELHIRPMFRVLDHEHMISKLIDLWKYNDSPAPLPQQAYLKILNRLKAPDPSVVMPPPNEGGPWPAEWIALFERWIAEGMRRLDNGTADLATLQAVRDPATTNVTILVEGQRPSPTHVVWIERAYDPDRLYNEYFPDQFVLYQEQKTPSPPASTPFAFDDFFDIPIGVTQLTLIDSTGSHVVAIT